MRATAPGSKGSLVLASRCYRAALRSLLREDDDLSAEEEAGFVMLADALQGLRRL